MTELRKEIQMVASERRMIRGVRYAKDAYGWIWREVANAKPGEPHWLRTGFSTFDQIEALGERITEKR